METRICNKCLEEKAIHFFAKMKQPNGKYYIRLSCRKCNNQEKRLKTLTQLEKQQIYKRQNEFVKNNPEYQLYLKLKHRNYRKVRKIQKWLAGDETVAMTLLDFKFKERMEMLFQPTWTWENYAKMWQVGYIQKGLDLIRQGRAHEVNLLENLMPIPKGAHIGRPKKMPDEYAMYKN